MLLRILLLRLSYRRRLALTDRLLPPEPSEKLAVAGAEFRARRSEWAKFAILGSGAALAAILAAASWDGAGREASRALAQSAYWFVGALVLAVFAIALSILADLCRVDVVFRRYRSDSPPWDQEEAERQHWEMDEYENNAHVWIPAAVRWSIVDWGSTLCLSASAALFLWSAFHAVHSLERVLA